MMRKAAEEIRNPAPPTNPNPGPATGFRRQGKWTKKEESEFQHNPHPLFFYSQLVAGGVPPQEALDTSVKLERIRIEEFESPGWTASEGAKLQEGQCIIILDEVEKAEEELIQEELESRQRREMDDLVKQEKELRENKDRRVEQSKRAKRTSLPEIVAQNSHQNRRMKTDLLEHQQLLLPLIETTQKNALAKLQESHLGKYLGEAHLKGDPMGNVKRVSSQFVLDLTTNKIRKAAIRRPDASPAHHVPQEFYQEAARTQLDFRPSAFKGLTQAEVDTISAHLHQKQLEARQKQIDVLWNKTYEHRINLPEGYIESRQGLVDVRHLTNAKKLAEMLKEMPEKAAEERKKLEDAVKKQKKEFKDLKTHIDAALETRQRLEEGIHVDATGLRKKDKLKESQKARSRSVMKSSGHH